MSAKLRQLHIIKRPIEKDDPVALPLARGSALSALAYTLALEFNYTIATATYTGTDYQFLENALGKISLEIGAGKKKVDLGLTDHLLINLLNRGFISCRIPKTVGTHTAKVNLIIDMTLVNMLNPKDSIFHTWKYDHRVITVNGGVWDSITNLTMNSAKVALYEDLKEKVSPNIQEIVVTENGKRVKKQIDFNIMKNPLLSSKQINGDGMIVVEFPQKKKVLGAIVYAIDGDSKAILNGNITEIIIKNSSFGRIETTHELQNQMNRCSKLFDSASNSYWNNIAYFDFSQGQLSEAIDTKDNIDEDTEFNIETVVNGANKPQLKVLFLCTDNA